ncbi:sulfite oxidase heme-binding subunit YedZ [Roseibium sediminicola]|uniref:Protein-methionine-sulfoxide reductase heme-binding subunit MsrQ n=1 Tax=Roseibium sediminicola TaxID=2933272 RepID=A0ABT0GY83_9HYPH|nr:protein-methionine-sulfoxide reductase heme-binding subunit MsrQ [Roseibium sp. CAU 1639]MCK7614390.1 sulfoxide reductase heme-binding subunit YedZ [Roseibium sp. CAU 1639]
MHILSFARYAPWTDRRGQLSWLRLAVFAGLLLPAAKIFYDLAFGPVLAEPYEAALHSAGDWTVRLLLLTLAITPIRRIFSWNRIAGVRRMIGVSVLAYALLHLGLYAAEEQWNLAKVASEIVQRIYLTIGFTALFGLSLLGATSFDAAIRRLGRGWQRLHSLVYGIGILALVHFFLQSKSDVTQATLMSGLFLLLMLYRLAVKARFDLANPIVLAGCAVLAAAGTAGIEYAWYALATGIPADRVFAANFDVATAIRPAIWVGLTGLGVAVAALVQMGVGLVRPRLGLKRV